jgi:hypothetical protein
MQRIVVGDKTWVHSYELVGKRQRTEWKRDIAQDHCH